MVVNRIGSNTMISKVRGCKTASDIVNYVLNNDILNSYPNRESSMSYKLVRNPFKINSSAFDDCELKDFNIHSLQNNMLNFYAFTRYDYDYASYFIDEVFRFMDTVVAHCNNGQGIIDKPLYVSIEFHSLDEYDESLLKVDTFSKCYNVSKVQKRSKIVGTQQEGLYNFDEVMKLMKSDNGVLFIQGGNYILQDFPYMNTVRVIDENELVFRKPFVYTSKSELRLLTSKPITMKRYFDITSLQLKIDSVITRPLKNYLMWDSICNCFRIIHEES